MLRSASPFSWALFFLLLLHSTWSGWQAPTARYSQAFPVGPLGLSLALAPGVAFAILGFTRQRLRELPYPALEARADRFLGFGMYRHLFLSAGIYLVLGIMAATAGAVGVVRGYWLGAAASPLLTSGFMLSGGIGMLSAYLGQRQRRGAGTK